MRTYVTNDGIVSPLTPKRSAYLERLSTMVNKKLVDSFDWTDANTDLTRTQDVTINGRKHVRMGRLCATTVVGNLYKLDAPSNQPIRYLLLVGVAKQHPCDSVISKEEGIEAATVNALTKPAARIYLECPVETNSEFANIARFLTDLTGGEFVKTRQEIKEEYLKTEYGKKYPEDFSRFGALDKYNR